MNRFFGRLIAFFLAPFMWFRRRPYDPGPNPMIAYFDLKNPVEPNGEDIVVTWKDPKFGLSDPDLWRRVR